MAKVVVGVVVCVLFGGVSLSAQTEQVFKGRVCLSPEGRTPTTIDGELSLPCMVPHPKLGAKYILFDPETKTTYKIEGHPRPKSFAGMHVTLIGTLDNATGTIQIDDMYRALPPKIAQAKSVYIDCNACPRGLASAWRAAFDELTEWGRFDIIPDLKKADLIFLFAGNPYLGDYVTRDGPDKRPVAIKTTYMNVVDPQTGQNLWDDSRVYGSMLVSKATRELIRELKLRMEEESQSDAQSILEKEHNRKKSPSAAN